jgi:hypothetical protein
VIRYLSLNVPYRVRTILVLITDLGRLPRPICTLICGAELLVIAVVFASTDGTAKTAELNINADIKNFFIAFLLFCILVESGENPIDTN